MLQLKAKMGRAHQSTIAKSQFAHRPEWMHFNEKMQKMEVDFSKDNDSEDDVVEQE